MCHRQRFAMRRREPSTGLFLNLNALTLSMLVAINDLDCAILILFEELLAIRNICWELLRLVHAWLCFSFWLACLSNLSSQVVILVTLVKRSPILKRLNATCRLIIVLFVLQALVWITSPDAWDACCLFKRHCCCWDLRTICDRRVSLASRFRVILARLAHDLTSLITL